MDKINADDDVWSDEPQDGTATSQIIPCRCGPRTRAAAERLHFEPAALSLQIRLSRKRSGCGFSKGTAEDHSDAGGVLSEDAADLCKSRPGHLHHARLAASANRWDLRIGFTRSGHPIVPSMCASFERRTRSWISGTEHPHDGSGALLEAGLWTSLPQVAGGKDNPNSISVTVQ